MNEREWADRLVEDLDKASSTGEVSAPEILPDGFNQRLEIARLVSQADYSGDSRVYNTLRERLKNRAEKEFPRLARRSIRVQNISLAARWAAGAAVLLFLVFSLNWVLGHIRPGVGSPTPTSNSMALLENTRWVLATIDGQKPVGSSPITLNFKNGEASGSTGCNDYRGVYPPDRENQKEVVYSVTVQRCDPPGVMQQEKDFLQAFWYSPNYVIEGNILKIINAQGDTVLTFERQDQGIEKTPTGKVDQIQTTNVPIAQCKISGETTTPNISASSKKEGWSQYQNKTYGFDFSFPTGWTVVEGPHQVCIFQPQEPYQVLLINSMKAMEAMSLPQIEVGAGDIIQKGSVRFLGREISRDVLVYQGKDKAVLYSNAQNIQIGDMIFTLSLDDFNPNYDAANLSSDLQDQVNQIVESFAVTIDQPPAAQLEINGITQTAGVGPYCWNIQKQGDTVVNRCADMSGLPTSREALLVTLPARARLSLPVSGPPDSLELAIMAVTSKDEINPNPDNPYRWWQPGAGQAQGLPLQTNPEFDFPLLDDGLYVLQVSARWRDPGSVEYGFLIQVGSQGATPVPLSNAAVAATQPAASETNFPTLSPMTRIGKGVIKSFALSPDGRWAAVSTPLGVYQYHASNWEQAWFNPSGANAASMAFSHDSLRLALSITGGEIELLDASTGKLSTSMQKAGDNFVWSPDDSQLVSGGDCHTVTVWDANSGEKVKELLGNQCSEGYSGIKVAWSSDGNRIYAALPGDQSRAWDAQTFQSLDSFKLEAPPDAMAPAFIPSPSGDILALFDWMSSSTVTLLDGSAGKRLYTLDGPENVTITAAAWSPDGKQLAVGYGSSNETWVWDTGSRQVVQKIKNFYPYSGLSWLPDGQALLGLIGADGKLYTVDVKTGKGLNSLDGHASVSAYLAWNADGLVTYDGRNLAWGEPPGSQPVESRDLTWWDVQTGQPVQGTQTGGDLSRLFRSDLKSPDGAHWVSGDQVMDLKSKQVLVRLEGTSGEQRQHDLGAWSPDGKSIASGDSLYMQPVVIWDPVTGKLLKTLQANTGTKQPFLDALAWSPDSKWLAGGGSLMDQASGSHDGMILVWDANTGEQVRLLTGAMFQDRVQVLDWSPDGKWLAAGLYSGQIVIWNMDAYTPSAILQGHAGTVSGLAWSPDGIMLASVADDGTMLIWKID